MGKGPVEMKKTANIIFFILMYIHKPYFSSNFEVKENNF